MYYNVYSKQKVACQSYITSTLINLPSCYISLTVTINSMIFPKLAMIYEYPFPNPKNEI